MIVHNQAHCLYASLRSILNQSFKNIEIIIIDDCSEDNSTEIIREFKKEDSRIIFLEHAINEGPIKTRTDGIRIAKGKFITFLDGDDSFIHKDILKNSIYIAQKANLDIVEFKAGMYKEEKLTNILGNYSQLDLSYIIYQPELKTKFIIEKKNNNFYLDNRAIWGKLISTELLNKMLLDVGKEFTDDYIDFAEDTIMVFSLFHLANSYYLMKELGYFYNFDDKRKEFSKLKNKVCKSNNKIKDFSRFKFLKFLIGRVENNTKEQIYAYNEITTLVDYDYYLKAFKMRKEHYEIMLYIFNKALNFEFLNPYLKYKIIKLKNRAIKKQNKDNIK